MCNKRLGRTSVKMRIHRSEVQGRASDRFSLIPARCLVKPPHIHTVLRSLPRSFSLSLLLYLTDGFGASFLRVVIDSSGCPITIAGIAPCSQSALYVVQMLVQHATLCLCYVCHGLNPAVLTIGWKETAPDHRRAKKTPKSRVFGEDERVNQ